MAAIDDLRANDWLLDHVFASLPKDTLTKAEYGQREVDQAKTWFRSTKITVMMSTSLVDPAFPVITITLVDSNETETTLSDTHYVPEQDDDRLWPALTPSFQASYGPTTGLLTLPDSISSTLVVAPGMQVIDRAGRSHEVLEVVDDGVVRIASELAADFSRTVIKGKPPASITSLGSVRMKETYALGCHVQGEQVHLTYLHTLLVFILYKYKADLLEARGFERSTVSSSDFRRNDQFENEQTFSRHINLSGTVAHVWPETTAPKAVAITTGVVVCGAGDQENPGDQLWTSEDDALLVGFKR